MATKNYTPDSSIGQRLTRVQELKLEIDRLTEQLDEQKAYLLGHAIRNNYDTLACGPLKVSRRERSTWTYSQGVQKAEESLKARKQREQKDGTATAQITEHLMVSFSARVLLTKAVEVQQ